MEQLKITAEQAAFHELGHALAGLDQGLDIYGVVIIDEGLSWGGLTHCTDDVPDELIKAYLTFLAAGPEASLVHCERTGAAVQDFAHDDRPHHAEVIRYAEAKNILGLPSWEMSSSDARGLVTQLWPRITDLVPVLVEKRSLTVGELR